MKLNKTFGRIATTLVATAMLASVAVVPAFADPVNGPINGNGYYNGNSAIDTFSFTKELEMPVGVDEPTVTFSFTLSPDNPVQNEIAENTTEKTRADVKVGLGNASGTAVFDGDETYTPVDYDNNSETPATTQKATATVTINVSGLIGEGKITEPGVYKYKLVESPTPTVTGASVSDFTVSDVERTVYLFVQRIDEQLMVTGVELYNGAITLNEEVITNPNKTDSILNYYMLSGDPDQPDPDTPPAVVANDLTVTKTVTGDMGNKSEPFTFSIEIVGTKGKTYNYTIDRTTGNDITGTITSDIPNESITLAHGESIKITGLSATDTYTIIETDAADKGAMNADGYTTSYKVNGGQQQDSKTATGSLETSGDSTVSTTVAFTNNRNAVSPTGLIMDIAPYALLVVVAAAGCFVFLRKRRED